MYIAVVQNNPTVGAIRQNAKAAIEAIETLSASPYPPDLVIFPAYAMTGTPVKGLQLSEAFALEILETTHTVIDKAALPTLIGTMMPQPVPDEQTFLCESEVLYCRYGEGGPLGFVNLNNKWDSEEYYSAVSLSIDGHRVSILLDDYPQPTDDLSDSEIVIMMLAKEYQGTNTMFTSSEQIGYLRSIARKNEVWLVVANLVGAQDVDVFDGASIVVAPDGSIVSAATAFGEGVITCNLDLEESPTKPREGKSAKGGSEHLVRPLLPYEADWKAIELFIRDYVHKNGFTDVVLGLSGGIDSAITAVLACDALGAKHVHGVMMPGPYSTPGSIDDSRKLANNLGIDTLNMPIDGPLKEIDLLSKKAIGQGGSDLARQNVQPRIRMVYLMHISNTFDWLVLNTSNKSETAMGYSTLYGDSAGAITPLGNIYKTDVYGLAHWRNERKQIIPPEILDKAPSAELYEGQCDQDTLPPYEILDRILRLHIEEGLGVDQIMEYAARDQGEDELDHQLVEKVLAAVRAAEFKRRQEPLAPTLGYMDICLDRDWPITNGFRDHHRDTLFDPHLVDYSGIAGGWDKPEDWDFLAN